jgi:hypothetical protein
LCEGEFDLIYITVCAYFCRYPPFYNQLLLSWLATSLNCIHSYLGSSLKILIYVVGHTHTHTHTQVSINTQHYKSGNLRGAVNRLNLVNSNRVG